MYHYTLSKYFFIMPCISVGYIDNLNEQTTIGRRLFDMKTVGYYISAKIIIEGSIDLLNLETFRLMDNLIFFFFFD